MINSDDLKPIDDLIQETVSLSRTASLAINCQDDKIGANGGVGIRLKALQDAKSAMVTAGIKQYEKVCSRCGIKQSKCQPGGQYYNFCPFHPTGGEHDWT